MLKGRLHIHKDTGMLPCTLEDEALEEFSTSALLIMQSTEASGFIF